MVAQSTPATPSSPSARQLRANRRNAKKSTGPQTPEGKARSSRNALKHGLCSADIVVEGEDRRQYSEYRIEMIRSTRPRNQLEMEFAEHILRAGWKLRRLQGAEAELYRDRRTALQQRHPGEPVGPGWVAADMLWDDQEFRGFGRYERQLTSMMHRAMDQLRKLRKDDPPETLNDFAAEQIEQEEDQMKNEQIEASLDDADASDDRSEGSDALPEQILARTSDVQREAEPLEGLQKPTPPDSGA